MKVCDIVLKVDKSSIGSKGIGEFTKSEYSHTAILTELGDVIEAEYPRVNKTSFEQWIINNSKREYYFSAEYECKVDVYSYVGKKYELGRFVNFIVWRIAKWSNSHVLASWVINRDDPKKVVCSELNGLCRGFLNPHKLTPDDFAKLIKKV